MEEIIKKNTTNLDSRLSPDDIVLKLNHMKKLKEKVEQTNVNKSN